MSEVLICLSYRVGYGFVVGNLHFTYENANQSFLRNLIPVKLQKQVLLNIMKGTSWAIRFESNSLTVVEGLLSTLVILVLASSVAKWVTGPGVFLCRISPINAANVNFNRECTNHTGGG
jgi:hypothetical protein